MPVPDARFELLYAGPRLLTDPARVAADLDIILGRHPRLLLRHGDCRTGNTGGDVFADQWALQRRAEGHDIEIDRCPAPWDLLGHAAGPYRNGFMAGRTLAAALAGHGGCVAHQRGGSTGSAGCAAFAEWTGIPVWKLPA